MVKLRVTAFVVQGDGIPLSDDSKIRTKTPIYAAETEIG